MSEHGRARVLAGSMSAISAATIVAVLLGVSIVVSHVAGTFGAGGSVGRLRVEPFSIGAPPQQTAIGPATGPPLTANAASSASRPGRSTLGSALPIRNSKQPRGGPPGSGDVGASAHVGPVRAWASAGSDGVTATVAAGPVKKKAHVKMPPRVAGVVQKTVCTLLSC